MKQLHAFAFSMLTGLTGSAQMFELETVVSGLTNPVDIAHCGDARLFIVEQAVPEAARRVLQLIPTRDGAAYLRSDDGELYRAFVFIERAYKGEAMLPLRLFGNRTVAVGAASSFILGMAMCAVIIYFLAQGDGDRRKEEAAREYFDAHGRWPDEN